MGNLIIINLSLFSMNQTIIVQKDDDIKIKRCAMAEIPDLVIELCRENTIFNVKIKGAQSYGEEIAQEIITQEKIKYSKNKIHVEVI